MPAVGIALALHVIGVVIWIGGVTMVTTIIIPAARHLGTPAEQIALFSTVERRFVWQARGAVILVGLTGGDLMARLGLASQMFSITYWWLWLMIIVWIIFATLLFVVEPLAKGHLEQRLAAAPQKGFAAIARVHWLLLVLSALAIAGAVAGSHGLSLL